MANEMVEWVEKKIGPPATILKTKEEVKDFISDNDVAVIGFFSDPESNQAKTYLDAVRDYEEYPCGITSDMESATKYEVCCTLYNLYIRTSTYILHVVHCTYKYIGEGGKFIVDLNKHNLKLYSFRLRTDKYSCSRISMIEKLCMKAMLAKMPC